MNNKTIKFNDISKKQTKNPKSTNDNNKEYVYIKDSEGFVTRKEKSKITQEDVIITREEWAELSGENHYVKTYGWGGVRANAGRKCGAFGPKTYTIRVTLEENALIKYMRENGINPHTAKQILGST